MTIVLLAPSPVTDDQYAAQRIDEQELLDAHPTLVDRLIELAADPDAAAVLGDADEVAAAAVIVLERRLSGVCPRRPS
jgi:hypothetical protein